MKEEVKQCKTYMGSVYILALALAFGHSNLFASDVYDLGRVEQDSKLSKNRGGGPQ